MEDGNGAGSGHGTSDYGVRIARVIDYVAAHLDEDLDLERLARVACFSPFHFHRIYHAMQGETARDTVRRLRLHRAALDLLAAELPIERIARRAGYASQAAFTRAFRSSYGAPPARYQGDAAIVAAHVHQQRRHDMYNVEIIDSSRIRVAALAHQGDYHAIGSTFDRLIGLAADAGLLRPDARSFGIYYDDPAARSVAELRSEACVEAPTTWTPRRDEPLRDLAIAAGRYARVEHVGPYVELPRAYAWLYGTWLPASGEEAADRPAVEEYLNDPRQVPAHQLRTTVWLPLQPRAE
jgi:AraC family transcriptional regulator